MSDSYYRNVPALAAYIDRIGAEELNFRRFMVKEHRGAYYIEKSLILLDADGTISCNNKSYAPTKDEEAAIKAAFHGVAFPHSIPASRHQVASFVRDKLPAGAIAYEFFNRGGDIVMLQVRTVDKEGQKQFLPVTLWSDGEWRWMEPEGKLPFWRPTPDCRKGAIMIHEGAKAAKFVTDLIADYERCKAHPWGRTLAQYEHWGMIGGALAPHRADYEMLQREKPAEVVYVCDNDFPGKSALQEVSRHYGGAMKGVTFTDDFPPCWDLADDMPKRFFAVNGRYIGPAFWEFKMQATRATEMVLTGEKGRPAARVKPDFIEEWFHSVTPEVFIHRDYPDRIYTPNEFNNVVRPFSDVDDTARLLKAAAASKSGELHYQPGREPGIYGVDGRRYINTHVPSGIKAEPGDPAPFLEFMQDLVTDERDRIELLRWCATLIARPDIKMHYGVLLISEAQGVGKGTLAEKILKPLLGGKANVSTPSERDIVDSSFNSWAAHKRLAIVHEIYAGNSSKAYNTLKSVITDETITVNKKFQASYEIENALHICACSNSFRALQIAADDRRWLVPKLSEKKKPHEYWIKLNRWLTQEGGLGIIKAWAERWLETEPPVLPGAPAPWTAMKKEVVEEGYSPGMTEVARELDRIRAAVDGDDPPLAKQLEDAGHLRNGQLVIIDEDLVQHVRNQIHDGRYNERLEKPLTIRKVAKGRGWYIGEHRIETNALGRCRGARLICSTRELAEKKPSELFGAKVPADERLVPVNLNRFTGIGNS
jgi:hypothetical protein